MIINRRHFLIGLAMSGSAALWAQACSTTPVTTSGALGTPTIATTATRNTTNAGRQILRAASPGAAKQLDPAFYNLFEDNQIGQTIFDRLIEVDHTLTPQPMLAESWEATSSQSWTFKLREGVKFHHGALFSAKDVRYTFERLLNPQTGSPYRNSLQFIDKVEALGESMVQFRLHTPNVELPLLLASSWASIIPHTLPSSLFVALPSGT